MGCFTAFVPHNKLASPAGLETIKKTRSKLKKIVIALVALLPLAGVAQAQTVKDLLDTMRAKWNAPTEPFKMIGNVYYVGTEGLASYLITSPQGHILVDTVMPESTSLITANIEKLEASDQRLLVHLGDGTTLTGDLVLNATGPSTKLTAPGSTLLQNVLRRNLIAPDETDMGVSVAADHTVLTTDGERSPWLLALGPLLRGTYWETIAVPEDLVGKRRRVVSCS